MATLTALGASNGYIVGVNSIDTSGYVAVFPGFQKVYLADGRTYVNHGYNRIDFINTRITGVPSGALNVGEVVTQATSGATGYYGECMDIKLTGTPSGAFTVGELVTQADTNAKGYVAASEAGAIYVFPITYTLVTPLLFTTAKVVTGATSGKTITPSAVSSWYIHNIDGTADKGSAGLYHFIYRTTTVEFDNSHIITGSDSGKTITPSAVTAPPHWLPWIPYAGIMPDGGSNIGCVCFGRVFLNSMLSPHLWYCSRVYSPLDWDSGQTDVAAATFSQNAKAGEVGDAIVAMISYKDHYLVWGCANEMWLLQSDPLMGGINRCISRATGIFGPNSYCWDDKNNLYFMGTDGIYVLSADSIINAAPPQNITKQHIPKLINSLGLNRRTDRVVMGYDKKRYGIKVSVTQQDGQWATNWWLDLRTGGLFPEKFASSQDAASLFYFDSYDADKRGLLIGGYDGYIRKEDEATKTDDGDNAIEAHVAIGPFTAPEPREQVGINEISLVLGEESNGVTVEYYRGTSADEVVSNVLNEETAFSTKTLAGDSLQNSIIDRVSGRAVAVKIKNENAEESFSMEQINIAFSSEGRKK